MRHSAMALAVALATSLWFAPAVTAQTDADPTVKVEWTAPIGPFDGNEYVHFEGVMTGTIEREDGSTGTYEVPIEVIYPVDGGNGVAYVDPVNTGIMRGHPTLCEWGTYICDEGETERHRNIKTNMLWTRVLAGKWLFEEGYTHIAVQWDKTITDRMGLTPPDGTIRRRLVYGAIEQITDMYEILFDSARWLRAPSLEGDVPDPEPVDYVVWGGHSQASYMARWFIGDGLSQEDDGSPIFDGYLLSGAGIFCFHPDEYPYPSPCSSVPDAGEAKILQFDTQTDIEFVAGWAARDSEGVNLDNYRRWEIAGVSHIPGGTGLDLYFLGHSGNQNPADPGPAYRAAVDAMTNWLKNDGAPSNSPIIEGEVIPPVEEGELPVFETELDDDGNAVGGIRLPHMPRTLDNGDPAGAPVGTYRATLIEELDFEHAATVFIMAGGQLVPFDTEELNSRYTARVGRNDQVERRGAPELGAMEPCHCLVTPLTVPLDAGDLIQRRPPVATELRNVSLSLPSNLCSEAPHAILRDPADALDRPRQLRR